MAISPNKARLKKLMGITDAVPRRLNVITVTATARILDADESGAFVLLTGGSPSTLTLPVPAAGLHYEVYIGSEQEHIVQAQSNVMQGNYRHNSATTTMTRIAVSNKGKLTLHSSGRAIGDRLQFWSDGTDWYVDGIVNNAVTQATI